MSVVTFFIYHAFLSVSLLAFCTAFVSIKHFCVQPNFAHETLLKLYSVGVECAVFGLKLKLTKLKYYNIFKIF